MIKQVPQLFYGLLKIFVLLYMYFFNKIYFLNICSFNFNLLIKNYLKVLKHTYGIFMLHKVNILFINYLQHNIYKIAYLNENNEVAY